MGSRTRKDRVGTRFGCLPDSHGIFADPEAVACSMALMARHRPEVLVLLGDHVDFYALSRFDKDPKRMLCLQDDLDAGHAFVKAARKAAPHARILYLEGNHENRLQRWLHAKGPEVSGLVERLGKGRNGSRRQLLSVPYLLGLGDLGVAWVSGGSRDVGGITFKHGNLVRSKAGATAMAELEREGTSGASGHTHRICHASKTTRGGVFGWWECGCLCDLKPDYMPGQIPDWQHGVAYGSFAEGSRGRFYMNVAHIIRGKAMYGDKVVSA